MPRKTDTELLRDIKSDNISSLYFLYGKETFLLEKSLSSLIKKAVGSNPNNFNFQKFDSRKTPIEDIQTATDALPFMSERKCVVVNNLDVEAMGVDSYEKLKELVQNTYDSCVLIFYLSGIEINLKKQAKWRAFSALCEKHGVVTEFEQKDRSSLARALCDRASKRGCSLAMPNATRLIDICGRSLMTLYNETDKLCDYAKDGEITREMIEKSATPSIESSSFDLAKAVVKKNYGNAYSILNELFFQRTKPEIILGALSSTFVDLYRASAAISKNKTAQNIIDDFSYPKNVSFTVTNAMRDIKGVSAETMRKFILAINEADIKIKSTAIDKKIVLEELIGKMISAERKV